MPRHPCRRFTDRYTLTRNVHVNYLVSLHRVCYIFHFNVDLIAEAVPYKGKFNIGIHKVLNLCLGKWGTHNVLRVFILMLYSEERGPQLTQDEQRIFYKQGLRPAIEMLTPFS